MRRHGATHRGEFELVGVRVQPTLHRIVTRDGSVPLHPKAMGVLQCLRQRAPEAVTKEEILEAVWPETAVSDEVLTNAVYELRKAFGDNARNPRVIQTIHGRGYRLIAPVEEPSLPPDRSAFRWPRLALVGAALLLTTLGWIGARWFGDAPTEDDSISAARSATAQGRKLLDERRYEEAIVELNRALDRSPGYPDALDALANVYDILGDTELARATIVRAIETIEDEALRTRYLRRRAQIDFDTDAELFYLLRGNQIEPESAYWPFKLGWFYFTHRRDCAKSHTNYERSLELERDPNVLSYYGLSLLGCGRAEAALDVFGEYRELRPASADAHDLLGIAHARSGRWDAAQNAFEHALEIDPAFTEATLNLGQLLLDRGLRKQARSLFESFRTQVEAPSLLAEAHVALGSMDLQEDDLDGARSHARAAHRLQRDAVRALWLEGLVAARSGDSVGLDDRIRRMQALPQFALGRSTWRQEYLLHLQASAARRDGDLGKAAQLLEQAWKQAGRDRILLLADLLRVLDEAGKDLDADRVRSAALAENPHIPEMLRSTDRLSVRAGAHPTAQTVGSSPIG